MSENKAVSEQGNSRRETLKLLVRGLMIFGVEKDAIVGISAALQTEEQQYKLMDWMAENRGATVSDILEKTVEILDEYITEESDDYGIIKN